MPTRRMHLVSQTRFDLLTDNGVAAFIEESFAGRNFTDAEWKSGHAFSADYPRFWGVQAVGLLFNCGEILINLISKVPNQTS